VSESTEPPAKRPGGSLGRAAALMASGTMVSRVLGLVRMVLLLGVIGTALAGDAFQVANTLPNQVYILLAGGVLNAILVPQIVKASKAADGGRDFVNRLLTLCFLLLALSTLVMTAAAPFLVRIFASPSWPPEAFALANAFAFIAMPQIFFYGMYTILGQVLNANGRFAAYMWAPALANIVAIGGLLAFMGLGYPLKGDVAAWDQSMIWLLAGSATVSIMAQALVLLIPLRRMGFSYRPTFGFRGVGLGSASVVAFWTFAAIVLSQGRFAVVSQVLTEATRRASELGLTGAGRTAYDTAFLLFMLPHSLITVSLATALFTRVAHAVQDDDVEAVKADLRRGLRMPAVFLIPITIGAVVLVPFVVTTMLVGTTPEDGQAISRITIALLLGSVPMSWQFIQTRFFYAYEDAKTPFYLQIVVSVISSAVALIALLFAPLQIAVVVALGQVLANVGSSIGGFWLLRRRLGPLRLSGVVRQNVRLAVASVIGTGLVWGLTLVLPDTTAMGWVGRAVATVGLCGLFAGVTLAVARVMRVSEVDDLLAPVLRRLPGMRR
jgi:putative peptidoglycan lipid II flippase